MIPPVLLQFEKLNDAQKAVRAYFQQGGSVVSVLLVLLGLSAIVTLTYMLSMRLKRPARGGDGPDPWRLFHQLTTKLNLSAEQRRLLDTTATNLGLKNPAAMLLSRSLYDQWVVEARRDRAGVGGDETHRHAELVASTRATLFPET